MKEAARKPPTDKPEKKLWNRRYQGCRDKNCKPCYFNVSCGDTVNCKDCKHRHRCSRNRYCPAYLVMKKMKEHVYCSTCHLPYGNYQTYLRHLKEFRCTLGGKPLYDVEKDKFTFSEKTGRIVLNKAKLNILRCGNCENQMSSLQDLVKHYTREHKKVEKMAEPLMTCYVCKLNVGIYDFGNHFRKHTKAYLLSVAAMRAERKRKHLWTSLVFINRW